MLCATGLRARIILPASLWSKLDEAQQDTVLVHELAHLRHGDHWVRRLELLSAVLYWWHPAVWWSRAELRESSEQCCDAWVVWTLPRLARSYAEALVETVDFISLSRPGLPVLASGMGQFTDLKRRLVMINQASGSRSLTRGGYAAVCSLAGLLLPLAPSFAQEAKPDVPVPPEAPVEARPATPAKIAPLPPLVEDAPKANILVAPTPYRYVAVDDDDDAPKPKPGAKTNAKPNPQPNPNANVNQDRSRAEIDRARAQVDRLRNQLRDAERHLSDLQRDGGSAQKFDGDRDRQRGQSDAERERARAMADAQKERAKAMAEVQKERAKVMAEAQRERAKAMAEAQKARAEAEKARAMAAQERDRAMAGQKRANDEAENRVGVSPKPRIDSNFQYRVEPPRTEEVQRAGARLRAAGGAGNQADLERRLDQLERQLDQLMSQLKQVRQQAAQPTPSKGGQQQR